MITLALLLIVVWNASFGAYLWMRWIKKAERYQYLSYIQILPQVTILTFELLATVMLAVALMRIRKGLQSQFEKEKNRFSGGYSNRSLRPRARMNERAMVLHFFAILMSQVFGVLNLVLYIA